jgi:hypothetical protein
VFSKRYRVVFVSLCEEHNRVSVSMVTEENGLDPTKIVRKALRPQVVEGNMLAFQLMMPNMEQKCSHNILSFDVSPEEYKSLGSPAVNEIVTVKLEKEKLPE